MGFVSLYGVTVFITLEELDLHPIRVSKTYASDQLDFLGAEFRQRDKLKVNAVAELAGSDILIRGHIGTRLEAKCDRCGELGETPVALDFDLCYLPVGTLAREEDSKLSEA